MTTAQSARRIRLAEIAAEKPEPGDDYGFDDDDEGIIAGPARTHYRKRLKTKDSRLKTKEKRAGSGQASGARAGSGGW